jgi:hypothetical protein
MSGCHAITEFDFAKLHHDVKRTHSTHATSPGPTYVKGKSAHLLQLLQQEACRDMLIMGMVDMSTTCTNLLLLLLLLLLQVLQKRPLH